jgi:hypothetical protein
VFGHWVSRLVRWKPKVEEGLSDTAVRDLTSFLMARGTCMSHLAQMQMLRVPHTLSLKLEKDPK